MLQPADVCSSVSFCYTCFECQAAPWGYFGWKNKELWIIFQEKLVIAERVSCLICISLLYTFLRSLRNSKLQKHAHAWFNSWWSKHVFVESYALEQSLKSHRASADCSVRIPKIVQTQVYNIYFITILTFYNLIWATVQFSGSLQYNLNKKNWLCFFSPSRTYTDEGFLQTELLCRRFHVVCGD